jgi:hypothetical protein
MFCTHVAANRLEALLNGESPIFNGYRPERSMSPKSLSRSKHNDLAMAQTAVNVAREIKTLFFESPQ